MEMWYDYTEQDEVEDNLKREQLSHCYTPQEDAEVQLERNHKLKEYIIYYSKPYTGGHSVNAFPTFDKPWSELRDFMPSDVCEYRAVRAESKVSALAIAKRLWMG